MATLEFDQSYNAMVRAQHPSPILSKLNKPQVLRSKHFTFHMHATSCILEEDFWAAFRCIHNTMCDLGMRSLSAYHLQAYRGYGMVWFSEIEKVEEKFVGFYDELRELDEVRAAYKRRI
ncbi:MAG: hypothetical protein Q9184_005711 [Pyrenodesmia sp. 2 TL-2023]